MQEAFLFLLFVFFFAGQNALGNELRSNSHYTSIRRPGQDQVSKQQDLLGKMTINRKFSLGLGGTYLERFNLREKKGGAFIGVKPIEKLSIELGFQKGNGNEILPETETTIQSYLSWQEGLTPFFLYRDSRYSVTHLHALNVGMEVEKIPQWIIIPAILVGKATFTEPASTRDIFSYGFRVIYYSELKYSLSFFANKGKEASQGILGRSTRLIDTLTGGTSLSYYVMPELKADLTLDHTDYDQLRTQFQTTMLTLTWML
jgi:hypothetical protein